MGPGDGNDIVEGEAGNAVLDFFGRNIGESIDMSANGGRVRFTRNIANIVMDLNDVDRIGFHALAFRAADTYRPSTTSPAPTRRTVDLDLNASSAARGDAQPDTSTVNGTNGGMSSRSPDPARRYWATGLAAQTRIVGSEGGFRRISLLSRRSRATTPSPSHRT